MTLARPTPDAAPFGRTSDGTPVTAYTLRNPNGVVAKVSDYGGALLELWVPDRDGHLADVTLGFDTVGAYANGRDHVGALVGRYGNRIAGARFSLDGVEHALTPNDGHHHLHGGRRGFGKVVWAAAPFATRSTSGLVLTRRSPAGEEGYPGTLDVRVVYTLTDADALVLDYTAVTDAPTPVSLTHHAYFNLAGHGGPSVLDHELTLHASAFTPVGPTLIPTGKLRPVAGTPFDFTTATPIGARLDEPDEQLRVGAGYDHNYVLARRPRPLTLAARVHEPTSGRVMEVLTTEPGLQFYAGNHLSDDPPGKGGARYGPHSGFALETQHFPDSPNQPAFPPTTLRPGQTYRTRTVYRFSVAGS